jgi:NAD(P)-dependent dehydrogenase (short-subunit alcohol dehydrogenase family)
MPEMPATPDQPLSGKVALVTGARGASALKSAASRQLAALGAHVVVGARDRTKADAVVSELRGLGLQASALKLHVKRGSADGLRLDRKDAWQARGGCHRLSGEPRCRLHHGVDHRCERRLQRLILANQAARETQTG